MVTAIWPSYANFPNKFPASANVTSGQLLMIFLYWMVQTAVSCLPMYKLRYFFRFKAIVVPPAFFALFLWGAIVTHGGGPLVNGPVVLTTGLNTGWSAMKALNVIIGLFSSLAVNMPDFGRFSKYENAGYSQFVFLPLLGTLGALAPIFVTSAAEYLWGEYIWFMPDVIANFSSRAAMFFTGFAFAIATMGNQIAAGSYPFGNDISALAPRFVNIRRAALFMAVFCIASNRIAPF
jgi:NCS1 family nucleobase:cation symporter-1